MTKVKINYGIFGGERLGSHLRKALRESGYTITKDEKAADIIIAHSAGCFWLPKAPTHQKLMLIDPPYWPDKTVRERARAKAKTNFHFRQFGYGTGRWLARNAWGVYYAVRDFRRTYHIIRHAPHYDLEAVIKNHQVLLVRNKHDPWLTTDTSKLQTINPHIIIKQLPGEHDDWFFNPQPYVDLLQLLQ